MRTRFSLGILGACTAMIALGQISVRVGVVGGVGAVAAGDGGGDGAGGAGPDVLYSDCTQIWQWGALGGIQAYSLGSHTCNIGNGNLFWGITHNGTPALGMNAYRLENGRLMQIGMSFAKHSANAGATPGCGVDCNGQGGTVLGVGCRDVYSSHFNGSQGILGPRSEINPWTGLMSAAPGGNGDAIFRRLQIAEADLDGAIHPDAQYFAEGVYVASDEARADGVSNNNASHKRLNVAAGFALEPTGLMQQGVPAIVAWQTDGGGEGIPDPSVELQVIDVPGEGRFHVASKTTDLGGGSWQYDYAIFNLNSDRSAGSFVVPVPEGVSITDAGFHDVDYHSGEVYDNTDWTSQVTSSSVAWTSPASHAVNPDSNALRWGTMYNFWFTADAAPADVSAQMGLFKPGIPATVTFTVAGPAGADPCAADLDGDDAVGFADLLLLLSAWGSCGACAEDIDGDGNVAFNDLVFLLSVWGPC